MSSDLIVLPRPRTTNDGASLPPIKGPSEAAFTTTFGKLLPQASYLQTPNGRAAYYSLPPLSPTPKDYTGVISRVLLVHGVQTPAIGLQPLVSALSSRFPHAQCVLVDLWGHGLTDTPFVPHEPALFHTLLRELMTHLEWENAHFIGYSFGGSTTATFAAAFPELVASMVLVAPAGLIRADQFDELQKSYLRGGGEGVEEKARAWILEYLEGGQLTIPSNWEERIGRGEVVAEAVRAWQLKEHKGHLASVVGIFRDGGVLDKHAGFAEAAKQNIPSLCILGELDDLCTPQDLYKVGMENVAVVPQVGHGIVREKVPEVVRLIVDFWNKIE